MFHYFVFLLTLVSLCSVCVGVPETRTKLKTNEDNNSKGHQKIQARNGNAYYPCSHYHHNHAQDNVYSMIKAQSEGRIVNYPNNNNNINANHVIKTSASNALAQTVTLNSQIAVGGAGGSGGAAFATASIDQQHLPVIGRPPAFNAYLSPQAPPPPPPAPAPLPVPPPVPQFKPNFNRPNHYQIPQGVPNGYQHVSEFSSNRFQQPSHHHQNTFNYRPPQQQQINGNYAGSFNHQIHGQQHFNGNAVPSVTHNSLDGEMGHIIQETFAHASLDPTAQKHIYVHVPPEDLEEKSVHHAHQIVQPPAQKHYKIIFIKAPTYKQPNAAQLAAAAAAQQPEEKTLIYVLVKKPEAPSVEELQQIQETTIKHHKPEVYFIKYKTRKEGEDLQNQLLQQGSLPGIDEYGDDGIDIRSGTGVSSSVSTSSSYATSAVSTPSSQPPNEFYGVPIQ